MSRRAELPLGPWVLAILAAVLLSLAPLSARANPRACSPAASAWVERAGIAFGARASAIACSDDNVRVRLEPAGAPPLDVDVVRGAGRAFRTAGGWGLSPILEVSDWRRVPEPQRRAFDGLCDWILNHPTDVVLDARAAPPLRSRALSPEGPRWWRAPWGFLLSLSALLLLVWRGALRWGRDERRAALAVFAVGLGLRLSLGLWGPLHVNGQGGLWILGATGDPRALKDYGPGYVELFAALPAAGHLADKAMFAINSAIGAAFPVVVGALCLRLGTGRLRSLVVASLLALDPIATLIGATESYFPIIMLCEGLCAWSWLSLAQAVERRRGYDAGLWAIVGGGALVTAARLHPVAWPPMALGMVWLLVGLERRRLWERIALFAGVCGLAALALWGSSGQVLASTLDAIRAGDLARVGAGQGAPWRRVPWLVIALLPVLVVAVRPRSLGAVAWLYLLANVMLRNVYNQSELWRSSFERLYLWALVVAALSVTALPVRDRRRWIQGLALAGAIAAAYCLWVRSEPTTDAEEYRWTRGVLSRLPEDCRVLYVSSAGRRRAYLPTFVVRNRASGAVVRLDTREPVLMSAVLGEPPGCVVYLRVALCGSAEGQPGCAGVEDQLELRAIERREHKGVESYRGFDFEPRPSSALYEVVGVKGRDAPARLPDNR